MNRPKGSASPDKAAPIKGRPGHRRSSLPFFLREELAVDADELVNQRQKPRDQLQLSPEELKKRVPPRILYPQNPRAPRNITLFSFKENQFKQRNDIEQTVFHLSIDGTLMTKDSPEAAEQLELQRLKQQLQEQREEREAVDVSIEEDTGTAGEVEGRVLRNHFNWLDKSNQTPNRPTVVRSCSTRPPPLQHCSGSANSWIMYDAYAAEAEKHREGESSAAPAEKKVRGSAVVFTSSFQKSLKVLERVITFNAQQDIYRAYQGEEEAGAASSEVQQSLIPLWTLNFTRAAGKDVTALDWNKKFPDLLAVGFGSGEFLRSGGGYVCCFSLKNTTYPEYSWRLDSRVCSLDWHPIEANLLCVGLHGGGVCILSAKKSKGLGDNSEEGAVLSASSVYSTVLASSNVKTGKHSEPVWSVRWEGANGGRSGSLSFLSLSADGRLFRWDYAKNTLEHEQLLSLKSSRLCTPCVGVCLELSPHSAEFLAGSEEGLIFLGNSCFAGQPECIYSVPRIALSNSSIKKCRLPSPSLTLECSFRASALQAVADVVWVPFSSTAFAALTSDGVLHVMDLSKHRRLPVLNEKGFSSAPHSPPRLPIPQVAENSAFGRLAFAAEKAVIAVGEGGGAVSLFKLPHGLIEVPVSTFQSPDFQRPDKQRLSQSNSHSPVSAQPPPDASLDEAAWQAQRLEEIMLQVSQEYRDRQQQRNPQINELKNVCNENAHHEADVAAE